MRILIIGRQLHGQTKGPTTGDNRHLMDRVCVRQQPGHKCMACLMICRNFLFFLIDDHRPSFRAHHDLVFGHFQEIKSNLLGTLPGGHQRRFVDQVFQVSPSKTRGSTGEDFKINIGGHLGFLGIYRQDFLSSADIRHRHNHLAVKTTGTQQGGVKDIGSVGCRDDDNTVVGLKAIHLDEQLVQCLLALIVTAAEACATVSTNGIDLVDKDNAGRTFFALGKHVTDTGCTDTNKHLDKV